MISTPTSNVKQECERFLMMGNVSKAYTLASTMRGICERQGNSRQAAEWCFLSSWALYHQGRYADGIRLGSEAIELQPDLWGKALALPFLASMQSQVGDFNAAFSTLNTVDEISENFRGATTLSARIHDSRGIVLCEFGEIGQGLCELETAVKLYVQAGEDVRAASPLNNLGYLLTKVKRFREGQERVQRALGLLESTIDLPSKAALYDSLGFANTMLGNYIDAERSIRNAVTLFGMFSNRLQLTVSLLHLTELYKRLGELQGAKNQAQRALQLANEVGSNELCSQAKDLVTEISSLLTRQFKLNRRHSQLVYHSEQIHAMICRVRVIALTDEVAVITGETGTGKELIARALHDYSNRRQHPFIAFNCSTVSREMIESRLFGHRKGAFTGADRDQIGVAPAAEGGTLFLDEIGDLPLEAQGALLRFLQSGEIQPVGASKPSKVNVRVIAATNRDLQREMEAGRFRQDLFYRLNVATIWIPPLRLRTDDVLPLARHFAKLYSSKYSLPEPAFSDDETRWMLDYEWPGNVRELENFVKRRTLFGPEPAQGYSLPASPVPMPTKAPCGHSRAWRSLPETEKHQRLVEALESSGWNVSVAARKLNISRRTAYNIRNRLRLEGSWQQTG